MRLWSMHSIFSQWKSKRLLVTYMYVPCRLDGNLEIRIVGSYGYLQLSFNMKNKYFDLFFPYRLVKSINYLNSRRRVVYHWMIS